MPDRKAQERLSDWRAAERAEEATEPGSAEQRRAHATSRRARWAFEDAARLAAGDHGDVEPEARTTKRALDRLHEATNAAAQLNRDAGRGPHPETDDERDQRVQDEAEIARELSETGEGVG